MNQTDDEPKNEESCKIEETDSPSITPSVFFTEDEVACVNWDEVFRLW